MNPALTPEQAQRIPFATQALPYLPDLEATIGAMMLRDARRHGHTGRAPRSMDEMLERNRRAGPPRITDAAIEQEADQIHEMHLQGMSNAKIAKAMRKSLQTVNRRLKMRGVKPPTPQEAAQRARDAMANDVIRRYAQLGSMSAVAREFNCSFDPIQRIIKDSRK